MIEVGRVRSPTVKEGITSASRRESESANLPIVGGRTLGFGLLSIAYLVSAGMGLAPREVLIPVYMLCNITSLLVITWLEIGRLIVHLRVHFPDEYNNVVSRYSKEGATFSFQGLHFAFFLATAGNSPGLVQIRRRAKRSGTETLRLVPFFVLVLVLGILLSQSR